MTGTWPTRFSSSPEKTAHSLFGYEDILSAIEKYILARQGERIALLGPGGVGKTTLALKISQQPEIIAHFDDGILWARPVGYINIGTILGAWAESLGLDISHIPKVPDRSTSVRELLRSRRVLLILDGVKSPQDIVGLACGGHRCTTIITTRSEHIAQEFGNSGGVWNLEGFDGVQAISFLSAQAPKIDWNDCLPLGKDIDDRRFLPLILRLIAGSQDVHQTSIHQMSEDTLAVDPIWQKPLFEASDQPNEIRKLVRSNLDLLPRKTQEVFRGLTAFAPEPDRYSVHAAAEVAGASETDLNLLSGCGIIDVQNGWVSIHPIISESFRSPGSSSARKKHRRYYLGQLTNLTGRQVEINEIYGQSMWTCMSEKLEENRRETINALSSYQESLGLWEDYRNCAELDLLACRSHSLCQEEGRLCNNLGKAAHMLGDVQAAVTYYRLAEDLLGKEGELFERALVMNNLASILVDLGEFAEAQGELLRAIDLLENQPADNLQAYLHNNLGKIYDDLSMPIQARDEYLIALDLLKAGRDEELEITVRYNLSLVYLGLGRRTEAINELQKAVEIERVSGHRSYENDVKLLEKLQHEQNEPRFIHWLRRKILS